MIAFLDLVPVALLIPDFIDTISLAFSVCCWYLVLDDGVLDSGVLDSGVLDSGSELESGIELD